MIDGRDASSTGAIITAGEAPDLGRRFPAKEAGTTMATCGCFAPFVGVAGTGGVDHLPFGIILLSLSTTPRHFYVEREVRRAVST